MTPFVSLVLAIASEAPTHCKRKFSPNHYISIMSNINNNVLWAQQLGGTAFDAGWGIAADASGNTYVMGDFSDTVTFANTSLTSGGGNDSFIAKLDSSGNVLWAQKLGGSSYNTSSGITVDSAGNSYATGFFIRSRFLG
ncbi:MAG: SBBP repeat-containing protein [Nostoc sp.]|uniref:SBBP repeat-containing protein n=1 Tax=Nostoc sp. TaxID=1180 RepID=UPI002FFA8838